MLPFSLLNTLNSFQAFGASVALIDDQREITYQQLFDEVTSAAQWLNSANSQVVALLADNSVDWVVLDLAAQLSGVIFLPIPLFFSQEQIDHCIHTAGVDLLVTDRKECEGDKVECIECPLETLRAINLSMKNTFTKVPETTGKITFTSGTTGSPKGVCLSNAHLWRVAHSLNEAIQFDQPKHLCLLPLATLLENIAGVYAPLLCGGCVYLPSSLTRGFFGSTGLSMSKICQTISTVEPNTLITIPQLLSALIVSTQHWQPPSSLSFVAVGGARVDSDLLTAAAGVGIPAFEGYGLSECASVVALNSPCANRKNYCGKVLSHCRVSIENNEVIVHDSCFLGYLGKPDSWYGNKVNTGDVGNINGDGWLTINGRKKNQIITSFGRNINPEWIESVLLSKPFLNHCVVVGEAKPFLITLVSAQDSIEQDTIQQWIEVVNKKLPDYAQVHHFLRIPSDQWQYLLTANGRPRRNLIEKQYTFDIEALYKRDF